MLTPLSAFVVGLATLTHRSTLESAGSWAVTYTVNENMPTVVGTFNCQLFAAEVDPEASTEPLAYLKKGWFAAVNVPVPSAFPRVAVPLPLVTIGPLLKKTFTPPVSAVVPSALFIGCTVRFSTVKRWTRRLVWRRHTPCRSR